jgi:CheY-like chemotaxis protein
MGQKFKVLMVEDDDGDARLTREAIRDSKIDLELEVVGDGVEALAYLRAQGVYAGKRRPDLVLLDLNLPRMGGQEVLQAMRADAELKHVPVVVLTTSEAEEDLAASYAHGANCYVTKPVGFEQFSKVVKSISSFWFTIVRLPTAS